jgi:hypothetical protein
MSEKRDGRDVARPQPDRAELERKWGDAIAKALRTPPQPERPGAKRQVGEILRDIEAFRPVDGMWLPLEGLLAELWEAGVPRRALPVLFGVFERFPRDDGAGVLWSIVHGVESLDYDYEQPLRESLARSRSELGEVMLDRLERSKAP